MNAETGRIYEDPIEIAEAEERGEKLIHMSPIIAKTLDVQPISGPNRAQRRANRFGRVWHPERIRIR